MVQRILVSIKEHVKQNFHSFVQLLVFNQIRTLSSGDISIKDMNALKKLIISACDKYSVLEAKSLVHGRVRGQCYQVANETINNVYALISGFQNKTNGEKMQMFARVRTNMNNLTSDQQQIRIFNIIPIFKFQNAFVQLDAYSLTILYRLACRKAGKPSISVQGGWQKKFTWYESLFDFHEKKKKQYNKGSQKEANEFEI